MTDPVQTVPPPLPDWKMTDSQGNIVNSGRGTLTVEGMSLVGGSAAIQVIGEVLNFAADQPVDLAIPMDVPDGGTYVITGGYVVNLGTMSNSGYGSIYTAPAAGGTELLSVPLNGGPNYSAQPMQVYAEIWTKANPIYFNTIAAESGNTPADAGTVLSLYIMGFLL